MGNVIELVASVALQEFKKIFLTLDAIIHWFLAV